MDIRPFHAIWQRAIELSESAYPDGSGFEDKQDALRHILASGLMTRKYGGPLALGLGAANELRSDSAAGAAMDLFNNRIGVQLGKEAKDEDDLLRRALAKVEDAQLEDLSVKDGLFAGAPDSNRPVIRRRTANLGLSAAVAAK